MPAVSDAKLRANRANAKKSTGPRTPEGKARVSQNGIGHGLFCKAAVLPGESETEFLSLRLLFHTDLVARDAVEFAIVERAVLSQWKMRRAQQAERKMHITQALWLYRKNEKHAARMEKSFGKYCFDTPEDEQQYEQKLKPRIAQARLAGDEIGPDDTLASDFILPRARAIERLSRYEHRLLHHFYQALHELERYRKSKPKSEQSLTPFADLVAMTLEMEEAAGREKALLAEEAEHRAEQDAAEEAFDEAEAEAMQAELDALADALTQADDRENASVQSKATEDEPIVTSGGAKAYRNTLGRMIAAARRALSDDPDVVLGVDEEKPSEGSDPPDKPAT